VPRKYRIVLTTLVRKQKRSWRNLWWPVNGKIGEALELQKYDGRSKKYVGVKDCEIKTKVQTVEE